MPFKTFNNWLFDCNIKSEFPNPEVLLKYNSPITHTYVLSLFVLNAKLNHFLNEYFNNVGVRYLDKEEFFRFIKKCVIDFKVQRKSIPYVQSYNRMTNLFNKLEKKVPLLKKYDIALLCDIIDKDPEKELIYSSLGLDNTIKPKNKKEVKPKNKKVEDLLAHFSIVRITPK